MRQNISIKRTNRVVLLINLLINLITFTGYLVEVLRGERTLSYLLIFSAIILLL
jgi:hypothetical protein